MKNDLQKTAGWLILLVGLIFFFISISNNNLNFALISLTISLIFWVLYGLIIDYFNVQIFVWIISASGLLIALSIFIMFGIEEVPFPIGAIVFHSEGFAAALGIGLFSLFPVLFFNQNRVKNNNNTNNLIEKPLLDEIDQYGDDWELATDEDLQSDDFES